MRTSASSDFGELSRAVEPGIQGIRTPNGRHGLLAATATLCLAVSAVAGTRPTTTSAPAITEAWRSLFADPNAAPAPERIEAALAACGGDASAVRKLIAADTAYPAIGPGWHRRTFAVADGPTRYEAECFFHVPPGYRPDKPHPVLLAAHWQDGTGQRIASAMLRMLGGQSGRYIVVGPTMPGPSVINGKAYQEEAYLASLAWVRRALNVDDDRVYISGYSLGGHVTWHLAVLFPHEFAAAVPMAGVPWFEGFPYTVTLYLENVANLPVWAIWGAEDKPAPPELGQADFCRAAARRLSELDNGLFKGTELLGVGHEGTWADPRQFAEFLAAHTRKAAPEKVSHCFHQPRHGRGYYLEALQLARQPMRMDQRIRVEGKAPLGKKPDPREGEKRMLDLFARGMFRMWAELDRPQNSLTIRASGVRVIRLHVIDGLFDLGKPVRLRFGPQTWQGKIPISARCMLTDYAARRDAAAVVLNQLDLHDTGKVVVRYAD